MKRALLLVLTLLWPVCASACNACLEDKIAATYDWRVVSQAKERGHTVVFAAIRGAVSPGDSTLAHAVQRRLAAVRGVDPGTVRVSLAPPAASFACDGVHAAPRTVIAAANRALASSGHSLALVRVGAPSRCSTPSAARRWWRCAGSRPQTARLSLPSSSGRIPRAA